LQLNLSGNQIKPDGANYLTQALQNNTVNLNN